jgi:tetratricopeptide (TPR) repeat protein
MLAKDPQDRYATPRQLLHELRAVSIELFDDDPGEDHGWRDDDLLSNVEARKQATKRLAAAMKTSALPVLRRAVLGRWLLIAGCLALGALLAWALRERPLITAAAEDDEAIVRHDTAEAQYIYALMLGTEAAWKSVPEYFPNDTTYSRRASESLALLYLQDHDYRKAMKVFDQFAALNDAEVQFKAFGLGGQAIVLNRQAKYEESAQKLAQLWPLRDKLQGEMRPLVRHTLQSNREALGNSPSGNAQPLRRWTQWFRESAPTGPSRPREPEGSTPPPAS